MKILFITSFYSSLRDSIINNHWNPKGMPAISKLFEGLKRNGFSFDNVIIDRFAKENEVCSFSNSMFNNQFHYFGIRNMKSVLPTNTLNKHVKTVRIWFKMKSYVNLSEYDIIYVDRANIDIGGICAFLGRKVVLRLHGIGVNYEIYRRLKGRIINAINLLWFKAPFSYIIASEDGTPVKEFLNKFGNKKVKKDILLNGIDIQHLHKPLSINPDSGKEIIPIILFLSRLSDDKGIIEFIDAIRLLNIKRKTFSAFIVGDGKYFNYLKQIIDNNEWENITITGAVAHSRVYEFLHKSNIYVSLNKLGNLSNTALEAINSGKCIVTLERSVHPLKDQSTFNYLKDAALYIDSNNIVSELVDTLEYLIDNPQKITEQESKIQKCKQDLHSWEERISKEIDILKICVY